MAARRVSETYYSVGGGFIEQENKNASEKKKIDLPFPIHQAGDLENWCDKTGLSISELVLGNELTWRSEPQVKKELRNLWNVMKNCMYKGCHTEGVLAGGLNVNRRAAALNKKLLGEKPYSNYAGWVDAIRSGGHDFQYILDWVSAFALAGQRRKCVLRENSYRPYQWSSGRHSGGAPLFHLFYGRIHPKKK